MQSSSKEIKEPILSESGILIVALSSHTLIYKDMCGNYKWELQIRSEN